MTTLDSILSRCDAWEESKHPRDRDGEFTSGSGSRTGTSEPVSLKQTEVPPFIIDLNKRFPSPEKMHEYIRGVANEKLHTALRLIKQSGDKHATTSMVKKWIENELDERANRSA
jgi:hypothetical protein